VPQRRARTRHPRREEERKLSSQETIPGARTKQKPSKPTLRERTWLRAYACGTKTTASHLACPAKRCNKRDRDGKKRAKHRQPPMPSSRVQRLQGRYIRAMRASGSPGSSKRSAT
jgi:hypothetical protein